MSLVWILNTLSPPSSYLEARPIHINEIYLKVYLQATILTTPIWEYVLLLLSNVIQDLPYISALCSLSSKYIDR